MPRKMFDSDKFQFATDSDGQPIVYRPNEVIARVPDGADLQQLLDSANAALSRKHRQQSSGEFRSEVESAVALARQEVEELTAELEDLDGDEGQQEAADALADAVAQLGTVSGILELLGGSEEVGALDPIKLRRQRKINDHWYVLEPDDQNAINAPVDPVEVSKTLRSINIKAQPNYVYFSDTLASSPNYIAPNYIAPNYIAPNYIAPNYIAPNYIAPNYIAPNYIAGGAAAGGSCKPCPEPPGPRRIPQITAKRAWGGPQVPPPEALPGGVVVKIFVLDVREQSESTSSPDVEDIRANYQNDQVLDKAAVLARLEVPGALEPERLFLVDLLEDSNSGDRQYEDAKKRYLREPESAGLGANFDNDGYLDPVVNHSVFIKSIIDQRIQGSVDDIVELVPVSGTLGDVEDADLVKVIDNIAAKGENASETAIRVMNLSLSGYTDGDEPDELLAEALESLTEMGWLVVASAGNSGSCRLAWPAALPGVVAVGAYGSAGPAPFSNYGPWVDACAPGVNVVGDFPKIERQKYTSDGQDKTLQVTGDTAVEDFDSNLAVWSGTSFAAPYAAAILTIRAAHYVDRGATRKEAVDRALDELIVDRDLARIPGYGTVVSSEVVSVSVDRSPIVPPPG